MFGKINVCDIKLKISGTDTLDRQWSFACGLAGHTARSSSVWSCFALAEILDQTNKAQLKEAYQSSTFLNWMATLAVDNDFNTVACTHHIYSTQPWWAVDLGEPMDVSHVSVTNDHNDIYG